MAASCFGMDHDDNTVFDKTVDWAVRHGIRNVNLPHPQPYPGTALYKRMAEQGVAALELGSLRYQAYGVSASEVEQELERGYWRA